MEQKSNKQCCPSQLRYDIVSRDWVVIAPGRGKRPEEYKRQRIAVHTDPKDCVFCNLEKQAPPVAIFRQGQLCNPGQIPDDWTLAVVPNKYPAFCPTPGAKICRINEGPLYHSMDAAGFCEVVITRDHEKQIAQMDLASVEEIILAYQLRYRALKGERFVKYISIFHNHGVEAGASLAHPHSQIITSPLIDVDLRNALVNAKKYCTKHKKCLACEMTAWERQSKKRLVFENDDFIAVCPFAPKLAFEVIITPKAHLPYFENITPGQRKTLAQALSAVIKKICGALGDPAYNFYLHTAPADARDYSYYHWHWTIMPRGAVFAGFELGARIEISTITPETAAEFLRQQ